MSFSWTLLYSSHSLLRAQINTPGFIDTSVGRVLIAVVLSMVSFLFIYMLDKIDDADIFSDNAEHHLRIMIAVLGFLVGFTWEKAFHFCVDDIAMTTSNPLAMSTGLAAAVIAVVTPA